MGAPCFRAGFCSKTIIPDSEEHPLASSRAVPKDVLRWIRAYAEYSTDPDFPFSLVAAGQDLYGIKTPISEGDPLVIYSVDRSTGEPSKLATLPLGDFDRGFFFKFRLDNGTAYWAPVRKVGAATTIQIWSYRLGDPAAQLKTTDLKVPSSGRSSSLFGFDVDDGHFVFVVRLEGDKTHQLLLYDEQTGSVTLADPGLVVNEAQIIHFGEPGPGGASTGAAAIAGSTEPKTTPRVKTPPASTPAAPTAPTPTLAMTPLAKPDATAFYLEVGVTPEEFSAVSFCRSASPGSTTCVRELRELDARPEEVYTDESWEAIRFSLKLAQRLNHRYAEPEHLLYGLTGDQDGAVGPWDGPGGNSKPVKGRTVGHALGIGHLQRALPRNRRYSYAPSHRRSQGVGAETECGTDRNRAPTRGAARGRGHRRQPNTEGIGYYAGPGVGGAIEVAGPMFRAIAS